MDFTLYKNILSRLNKYAFELYIQNEFQLFYGEEHFRKSEEIEEVLIRDLNDYFYGTEENKHYGLFEAAYITHYFPLNLIGDPKYNDLMDPELIKKIHKVRDYYKGKIGYISDIVDPKLQSVFFVNNYSGYSVDEYRKYLHPKYKSLMEENGLFVKSFGVGNYDSFFELNPNDAIVSFEKYFANYKDGLRINITSDGVRVNAFSFEKNIDSGVSKQNSFIYEPLYVDYSGNKNDSIILEFEKLLNLEESESKIEEFLYENYRLIFGYKYDRIEKQLWLKYPDLDIQGKNRRLDLFLRNSVSNDWELFEIKKTIKLSRNYRDVPVFTQEVLNAIHQIKNYNRILSQDKVKRHFKNEGIEYFEPELNLVIGRNPQIPHEQWRWMLSEHKKEVKIITYDDLYKEIKIRYNERQKLK